MNHESRNRFDSNRTNLQALDSGLFVDESITCDNAENTGRIIQQILDNGALSDAPIKRLEQAITLAILKPSVKVSSQTVVIELIVLFSCLIVLIQRTNDILSYFTYELATIPIALFKIEPSAKDHKHAQRTMKSKNFPDVPVHLENSIDGILQQ